MTRLTSSLPRLILQAIAACVLLMVSIEFKAKAEQIPAGVWRQAVENDWITQEEALVLARMPQTSVAKLDAGGATDGVRNGRYGFHTDAAKEPWWQVDLGESQSLTRAVVWNRADSADSAKRAAHLTLRLSDDGEAWRMAYQHNGTAFFGFTDQKPLEINLTGETARFVRIQLPPGRQPQFLHLDEVEIFGPTDPARNLALNRPADQISVSRWSTDHRPFPEIDWNDRTRSVIEAARKLAAELGKSRNEVLDAVAAMDQLEQRSSTSGTLNRDAYLQARWIHRKLALANPLLDFDTMLVTKRLPGSFNHMSDQYYGWWSRPGGGLYLLRNFKSDSPTIECISGGVREPGSFLRPALSYDGRKVLFSWCRHYPHLAGENNKLDKSNVPEDAFYHIFEMNLDGTGLRQLTFGKYDDFDARYLPDGRIVFLSTRRGQFIQVGRQSAEMTVAQPDLPDCYVRCGGGPERPVAVYTLHTMNAEGSGVCAISPFEMFEWEPSVANDGTVMYARWDYIDRDNMPYMSLWSVNPDGANPRLIYGNYTKSPHCIFEPRGIPNSHKIIVTASGHHSQTMGSLVLLDPSKGTEGTEPISRLTPEVAFPEIERWPKSYFANPWPLSERFHLVAWGNVGARHGGPDGWDRWQGINVPIKEFGIYFFDANGKMELLYQDDEFAAMYPIPVRSHTPPPVLPSTVDWDGPAEGAFLVTDVYHGLSTVRRGDIKSLRIVAVPPKTHPTMNYPNLGVTRDDPGKCVLGTVPVEADGSAHFRAPAGVIVFFQALDQRGVAVQTMRSATHVMPGQTVSCTGCHKERREAPPAALALAGLRSPSKITVGPDGSWPLRFDKLIQPVLDRHCVACHNSSDPGAAAAKWDLTPSKSYDTLVRYGKPSLTDQVMEGYRQGFSVERQGIAQNSQLLALLTGATKHHNVSLNADDLDRLITWMDTYAQRAGSFSAEQERELESLRERWSDMLVQ